MEGQKWQQHRKLIAAFFNENNNVIVWAESLRQAKDMLQGWKAPSSSSLDSTAEDVRTLSLNVLSHSGFRKTYTFLGAKDHLKQNYDNNSTYRESLSLVLNNALLTMVFPQNLLSSPLVPRRWAKVGRAIKELKQHMLTMLDVEKATMARADSSCGSLVSSLVRASDDTCATERDGTSATGFRDPKSVPEGLSVDEKCGNIFVIHFAGHDTTASILAYAVLLMAAHPDCQAWVAEEIQYYARDPDPENWSYEKTFPRLKRCLAVLVS